MQRSKIVILEFIYRHIGNLMFAINGRLKSIHKTNRRTSVMYWAWSNSYHLGDLLICMERFPELLPDYIKRMRQQYPASEAKHD